MSFTDEDVQLAVKRGAYWLDEVHPGWAEKINLSGLVMQNCEQCVIGQAVGDYYETVAASASGEDQDDWAIAQGFQAPNFYEKHWSIAFGDTPANATTNSYYDKLEEVWTDEVRKRLG